MPIMSMFDDTSIRDTVDSCAKAGEANYSLRPLGAYLRGARPPHYPVPMHRHRDIESPLYHWYLVDTVRLYLYFH